MEVSVGKESLVVGGKDIYIGVRVRLDIEACKSLSWVIRLVRMLLVLCLKAC